MDRNYTISRLAKAVGVPTTTLRYYERAGLLRPEHRSQGNYRLYTEQSLHRLKFIRAAQAIGFTLHDVKTLLGMESGDARSCAEVQTVIQERLAEVAARLKDLRDVQRVLKSALAKCQKTQQAGRCYVMETLQKSP